MFAELDIWSFGLPPPVGLAIVVLLGYWVSWQRRRNRELATTARRDMNRARVIVGEIESISRDLQGRLATHHADVRSLQRRIDELGNSTHEVASSELSDEAEEMLNATRQLAAQVGRAYDEIRYQTTLLMQISEVRTDPLTGLGNRRSLDDDLERLLARLARYGNPFSVLMLDIDHFKQVNDLQGHLYGDQILQQIAEHLASTVRETDIVSRFGGEEFFVLLPETDLAGAERMGERLRRSVEESLEVTISGGVAQASLADTQRSLLSRADAALYGAKLAGRNRIHAHDGSRAIPISAEEAPPPHCSNASATSE